MVKTGAKARYFLRILLALMLAAGVLVPAQPAWAQSVADLSVMKFDQPPDTVSVGETLFYELVVNNFGPNTAEDVTVRDVLPPNTRFLFPFANSDCTNTGARIVTCDFGDLAPGEQAVADFAVCPTEPGTATNTATVKSNTADLVPTNDTDVQTTEVTAPAVPGGGCLSQEQQPSPPSDGDGGDGAPSNGAPEITQEVEQEAESGDIEQSFEVS